ncbi:MAG: hypothetical protein ACJ0Q3_05285, partial [Candidatus Azotimanducaceae bacterium]
MDHGYSSISLLTLALMVYITSAAAIIVGAGIKRFQRCEKGLRLINKVAKGVGIFVRLTVFKSHGNLDACGYS